MKQFDRQSFLNSSQKIKQFVGNNTEYYQEIFLYLRKNRSKNTLNFSALIFGSLWFFYRKMYLKGLLVLFLPMIVVFIFGNAKELIPSFLGVNGVLTLMALTWVLWRGFITLRGNYYYWLKYKKYFETEQNKSLSEYGGVASRWVIVVIVFMMFFYIGGSWLLSGMMQGMRHT